jgi:hypothetical protein
VTDRKRYAVTLVVLGALALVGVGAALLGLKIAEDDGDEDRAAATAPAGERPGRAASRPVGLTDLLRDPSALDDTRVVLDDVTITARRGQRLSVLDGVALLVLVEPDPPTVARGDRLDVRGRAILLPGRQIARDLDPSSVVGALARVAGLDGGTLRAIELLVVGERVTVDPGP